MSGNRINTLLVDSSEQDYTATRNMLAELKEWQVDLEWESTYEAALTKMQKAPYDICLLNYGNGEQDGLAFLREATKNGRTTSLILLLDSDDDNLAAEAMKAGAVDYLVRDQIDTPLLERSIRYAIKHKQLAESLQTRFKKQTAQLATINSELQQEVDQYKQIEEALRKRNQQYRMFFNLDVYGVEVLDIEGKIINCNTTYEDLSGYRRKEIIGQKTTTFISEKSKKLFQKKLNAIQKKGYAEGEVELVRRDGTIITLWKRYRAVYNKAGTWTGTVAYNRDITERMKAVKQISSLARALEQSPVAIMIADEAGNIEYINFKFTEITGYDYEEIIGQNLHTLQSETLSAKEYEGWWQAVTTGEEWQSELRSQRKDGQEYWESVIITPMFDSKGKITHFIVVREDVTERKETEKETIQSQRRVGDLMSEHISDLTAANEALEKEVADRKRVESTLRRSRARLKAQYKGIPMPTYSWQKAGENFILVDYNNAAERDTQGRIADFMGRPATEVFEGKKEILADFERCFDRKTMVAREAPYQLVTTGENKHFVTTYNFVPPNLVVVHIEDITKYKQIEEELRKHEEQLEALTQQQAADLARTKEALKHELVEHELVEEALHQTEDRLREISETLPHEQEDQAYAEEVLLEVEERIKEVRSTIDERLREQYRTIPIPTYTWQVIGGQFILIDFNNAAGEAMGRIVDFLGKPADITFKDRPQVLEDFATCYSEKRKVKREAPYQTVTTGEHKYFKTTYEYLPPNLIIVHIEDVTEQKRIESELKEYRNRLETMPAQHKAELDERNEAVRQEIHKRKQAVHTLNRARVELNKQKINHEAMIKDLANKHQTELTERDETLQQELAKRRAVDQEVWQLEKKVRQHNEKLEQLVKERTAELSKMNEQLQRGIVEHQRAEDSLREARSRLKSQYKGIPVPTYSWQHVGGEFILIDYNSAAEKASQGTVVDLMGKSTIEVFKARPQVLADFERCYNEKKTIKHRGPYKLLRTGETRHFVTTYNFVSPNLIIVYIEDITEYKQTEKALQESETRVELFCRFSPNLTITFVNNVYCWYFNKHREDIVGQETPFIYEKDLEKVKAHLVSFTPEKPAGVIEYRVVKPNGTMRWQQWINQAIFDDQGQLVEIESVGRDTSKRKKNGEK